VALGKIYKDDPVDVLIDVLKDSDKEIRIVAADTLGKIKDPRTVEHLIDVLSDKDLRITAIWALGNIRDRSAVPALTNLFNDQDEYVCYNVLQVLRRIGVSE